MLAVHLLAMATWVGGMAYALLVLRPSLGVLDPAARLRLHARRSGASSSSYGMRCR
ncbi:MAG: hypothetical protein WDN49_04170 [Acetobacteraceae bacterium]